MAEPKPTTLLGALRYFRWVQPYDMVAVLLLVGGITSLFWLSGHYLLLGITLLIIVSQLWAVCLTFRCSYFVLQLIAYVKTLPGHTARLTTSFIQRKPIGSSEELFPTKMTGLQFKILREVGWIKLSDCFMIALLVAGGWLCSFFYYRGMVSASYISMGIALTLNSVWCAVLLFRCSHFVLQAMADLRNIPQEAMRLMIMFERRP